MKSPRSLKKIQSLIRKLAALNRFISKATDKCHVFFQVVRRGKKIEWMAECEKAFQKLKTYLLEAPLLSILRECDTLYLYLTMSEWAMSSILKQEEDRIQYPMYYTSKALLDTRIRYPKM